MVETIYNIPNAPQLALLADLHGRPYQTVISSVAVHKPELICIAGDVLYGSHPADDRSPLDTQVNVLPFLRACSSIAPTFISLGNHEWMLDDDDLKRMADTGVTVLDNSWVKHDELLIGGLTSGYVTDYRRFVASLSPSERAVVRYPRKDTISGIGGIRTASEHVPETSWLSEFAAQPGVIIAISHHPEYFHFIPETISLVLSGHTHSGQIRYYSFRKHRWTGLWSPGQGWRPRYSNGVYEDGRLVVSAGLSNTTWVPRLFNPTEIVYLEP